MYLQTSWVSARTFLYLSPILVVLQCGLGGAEIHSRVGGFDFNPSYTVYAFEVPEIRAPDDSLTPTRKLVTVLTWASYDPEKSLSDYSPEDQAALIENIANSDGLVFVTDNANIVPGKTLETFTTPNLANTRSELTYWLNSESENQLAGDRHCVLSIDQKDETALFGRFALYFSTNNNEPEGTYQTGSVFGNFEAPLLTEPNISRDFGVISEAIPGLKSALAKLSLDFSGKTLGDGP